MRNQTDQIIVYKGTIAQGRYQGQRVVCYSISRLFFALRERASEMETLLASQVQTPIKTGETQ